MFELEERYTGKVTFDESTGTLCAGRVRLTADDIDDAVFCGDCTAIFGRRDDHPTPSCAAIGFRLKNPISHPGKLFSAGKTRNLLLRFDDAAGAKELFDKLPIQDKELSLPSYTMVEFPLKNCIVEAKKGMNNYTRGGTAGSRPYSKPGLVAPVIKPELKLETGSVIIHYMGLNVPDHESLWFRDHPHDEFSFGACTDITYLLQLFDERTEVSARFERYDIERDENATGLWSVRFDFSYTSICDALRWINTLTFSYSKEQASSHHMTSGALSTEDNIHDEENTKTEIPIYERLTDALSLLKDESIINDREFIIIKERIDKKR